jgi:hypothetical protein
MRSVPSVISGRHRNWLAAAKTLIHIFHWNITHARTALRDSAKVRVEPKDAVAAHCTHSSTFYYQASE